MKKLILIVLGYFYFLNIALSFNVEANIPSGEYDFPLEIYLNSDEEGVKIFYYTDGEGRFDNIKEYFGPIIITQDTKLNYFATLGYESTKIKENNYYFNYTDKLDLINKDNFLYIKNNSSDTQNIGLWKIKSDGLNFEIPKYTFIDSGEIYKIDYKILSKNIFYLYSPDGKLSKEVSLEKNIKNIKEKVIKIEEELKNDEIIENKKEEKNEEIIEVKEKIDENKEIKQEKNILNYLQNTKSSINEIKTLDNTGTISNQPKKETKTDNSLYIIIYLFVFITLIITAYNIYTVVKNSKNITNNKQ